MLRRNALVIALLLFVTGCVHRNFSGPRPLRPFTFEVEGVDPEAGEAYFHLYDICHADAERLKWSTSSRLINFSIEWNADDRCWRVNPVEVR